MSAGVPALSAATVTAPDGQARWAFPHVPRADHPTGVQVSCAVCVRAGVLVARLGLPFRFADDPTPLCVPCWRAEEFRRRRAADEALLAEFWNGIGGVEVDQDAGELVVADRVPVCAVCESEEPSPACWLCGYAWLREAEEAFAAEQAAAAALAELEFTRIAAVAEAEARVADVTGWIERLQDTVCAYEAGYGGRAVELLADVLARLEEQMAGRASRRGRPSMTPYVAAVLAVDADWRSGRRAMPGRERSAWLIGCSDRAVYDGWVQVDALGWATRTRVGGRNSLERRIETGRANDRAEFDLIALHRSTVPAAARAACVPLALVLLGELLEHALTVLEAEQQGLDTARAEAGGWTEWPERVRRTQLRTAVNKTRERVTDVLPAVALTANICRPHRVSLCRSSSSCSLWGLRFSQPITIHSTDCDCGTPPIGRSGIIGASRSPTTEVPENLPQSGHKWRSTSPRVSHHRTLYRQSSCSQARPAPEWAEWAYPLARGLVRRWEWLSRVPVPQVAAVLGARLGPHWGAAPHLRPHVDLQGADRLIRYVASRHVRPVLAAPDNARGYLAWLLDATFAGDEEPPEQARAHVAHRHQVVLGQAAAAAAAHEHLRAGWEQTAAAAITAQAGGGRAAAMAVAAAARGPARRRYVLDTDPARLAGARAPFADHGLDTDWPEPANPGGGLVARGSVDDV